MKKLDTTLWRNDAQQLYRALPELKLSCSERRQVSKITNLDILVDVNEDSEGTLWTACYSHIAVPTPIPNHSFIVLNMPVLTSKTLIIIAHEMGHYLNGDHTYYGWKMRTSNTPFVLFQEEEAWKTAWQVLQRIKFNTTLFFELKHYCLHTYYISHILQRQPYWDLPPVIRACYATFRTIPNHLMDQLQLQYDVAELLKDANKCFRSIYGERRLALFTGDGKLSQQSA